MVIVLHISNQYTTFNIYRKRSFVILRQRCCLTNNCIKMLSSCEAVSCIILKLKLSFKKYTLADNGQKYCRHVRQSVTLF